MGEQENPRPHSVTIVFSEEACAAYDDAGGEITDEVREIGPVETNSFATKAELDAFMQGVHAAEGWMGMRIVFDSREAA